MLVTVKHVYSLATKEFGDLKFMVQQTESELASKSAVLRIQFKEYSEFWAEVSLDESFSEGKNGSYRITNFQRDVHPKFVEASSSFLRYGYSFTSDGNLSGLEPLLGVDMLPHTFSPADFVLCYDIDKVNPVFDPELFSEVFTNNSWGFFTAISLAKFCPTILANGLYEQRLDSFKGHTSVLDYTLG